MQVLVSLIHPEELDPDGSLWIVLISAKNLGGFMLKLDNLLYSIKPLLA